MATIEPFTITVLWKGQDGGHFVEVQVAPEWDDVEAYEIESQDEYAALVHHILARNQDFFDKVHPGLVPEKVLFNEQPHPDPHAVHDFTQTDKAIARRVRRCICMAPCNGSGSYCCVWWWDSVQPRREVVA
jgi:hypothetical protein